MTLCSIIIPVSPSHVDIANEAVRSAENQTVRCEVIVEHDPQRTGAAATRNRAIRKASGLFVVALDADDLLEPDFVEQCAAAYQRGKYVYTDWYQDGEPRTVEPQTHWNPLRVYTLVTAFWPSALARRGFDETLPSMEDVDFYLWARFNGWHGLHLTKPLWHYRRSKGVSNTNPYSTDAKERSRVIKLTDAITKERYGGLVGMGCCGSNNSRQDNMRLVSDVQVYMTVSPRKTRGAVTGRMYPKPDAQGYLWMDKRDALQKPDMFHIIIDAVEASPDITTIESLVAAALTPKPQPTQPRVEDVYQEVSKPTETPAPKPVEKPKAQPPKRNKTRRPTGKKSA